VRGWSIGRGAVRVMGGRILDGLGGVGSYRGSVGENYLRRSATNMGSIVRG
jgi:hypothetical protein